MLATLAIQTEAWLQEELAAQRAQLALLDKLEGAARAGRTAELEREAHELSVLLCGASAREARRRALLGRLAGALALPARELTLSRLAAELARAGLETARLAALREELREVVAAGLKTGRRLAAVAKYHRGLLEELCQVFAAEAPAGAGNLVDARG